MSGNISRMNKQRDSRVHQALNVLMNIVSHPHNDLDELALHRKHLSLARSEFPSVKSYINDHENVFLLLQLVKKG